MGVKAEQELAITSGESAAHHVCPCVPAGTAGGSGDGRGTTSSCACVGVEKMVKRSGRTSRSDFVMVGVFVALLVGVAVALWR